MKTKTLLMSVACAGFALASQAVTVTWDFQENGTGNLGSSTATFTQNGVSLTAVSSGPNLFVKSSGGDESGLGLVASDNEINPNQYIALQLPTSPASTLTGTVIGSVQGGESAAVYFGATPGAQTTLLGTLTSTDGTINFSETGPGYISVFAPTGNILIDSVSGNVNVPDGGLTLTMLGGALTLLGFARRKLAA